MGPPRETDPTKCSMSGCSITALRPTSDFV